MVERKPRKWGSSTVKSSGSRSPAASALLDFTPLEAAMFARSTQHFLKRSYVLIELEKLSGKRMLRGKTLGAPDSRVVLGRTGLCGRHLRGGDESPTISLYQPGWKRLAKAMETSPRMTELNAPRSANTPM